jgi:hypothetical protein
MTPAEIGDARRRLGLTPERMAVELGIPQHAYEACEEGSATLPRHQAQMLVYLVAAEERDAALAASGLPECSWIAEWDRRAPAADAKLDATVRHMEEAQAHVAECPTCKAREDFVREHFPDMPAPPAPTWIRVAGAANDWLQKRPAWMRPALVGAAALAAMTLVRVVFLLPSAASNPGALGTALLAVLLASGAGAVGGLVYALAGRPLRGVPVVGPYLAGIVAVAGYMTAIVTMMALSGEERVVDGGVGDGIATVAIVSVLFGCVVGHQWLRPERPASAGR